MSKLIVEINAKDMGVQVQPNKDGTSRYSQKAYLDVGAAYPLPFKLSLQNEQGYAAGKYHLASSSFKTGQYGDLEINRFGVALERINS